VKWIKPPEALKERIESLMQGVECEKRPMFGYPAYFINKNIFAGLFGDKVFLRLSPSYRKSSTRTQRKCRRSFAARQSTAEDCP
jgi:hypothetical protein